MAFIPGATGTASSFPDGFTGSPLANVETISATKVLTTADRRTQLLTPSGALRIVQLPAAALIGEGWQFSCGSSAAFSLQINASNGTTIATLAPGEGTWLNALSATPTDAANWGLQIPSTVLANGTVSTPALRFTGSGSDTGIYSPTLDAIAFSNAGVQSLLLSNLGEFSLAPRAAISLAGAPDQRLSILSNTTSGNGFAIVSKASALSGGRALQIYSMGEDADQAGDMVFDARTSANAAFTTTTFDAFRFRHAGINIATATRAGAWSFPLKGHAMGAATVTGGVNLTLNTGSNSNPLTSGTTQTGGALRIRGNDNACMDFGINSSTAAWIQATDFTNLAQKYTLAFNPNGGLINFGNGAGSVTDGGAWTLGTSPFGTTTHIVNGGLYAQCTSGNYHSLHRATNAITQATLVLSRSEATAASQQYIQFFHGATNATNIGTEGGGIRRNAANNGYEFFAPSDARLKNITGTYSGGLNQVVNVPVRIFSMKSTPDIEGCRFIAQEVQAQIPTAVFEGSDGFLQLGESEFIPVMWNAIQELNQELQDAKARIATLEGGN